MSAVDVIADALRGMSQWQPDENRTAYQLDGLKAERVAVRLIEMCARDRLALARALVADMPGVVVARVPDPIDYIDADECEEQYQMGHNDCRSAIIAAGSPTDGR